MLRLSSPHNPQTRRGKAESRVMAFLASLSILPSSARRKHRLTLKPEPSEVRLSDARKAKQRVIELTAAIGWGTLLFKSAGLPIDASPVAPGSVERNAVCDANEPRSGQKRQAPSSLSPRRDSGKGRKGHRAVAQSNEEEAEMCCEDDQDLVHHIPCIAHRDYSSTPARSHLASVHAEPALTRDGGGAFLASCAYFVCKCARKGVARWQRRKSSPTCRFPSRPVSSSILSAMLQTSRHTQLTDPLPSTSARTYECLSGTKVSAICRWPDPGHACQPAAVAPPTTRPLQAETQVSPPHPSTNPDASTSAPGPVSAAAAAAQRRSSSRWDIALDGSGIGPPGGDAMRGPRAPLAAAGHSAASAAGG